MAEEEVGETYNGEERGKQRGRGTNQGATNGKGGLVGHGGEGGDSAGSHVQNRKLVWRSQTCFSWLTGLEKDAQFPPQI